MDKLALHTFSTSEVENILIEFSLSILEKESIQDIAWDVAKNCISRFGFEDCVIYSLDQPRNELKQLAAYGPKNPKDYEIYQPITIKVGEGISGMVAASGIGEIIYNTSTDPRYIADDQIRQSEITVPIAIKDQVLGVIDCEHSEKGFFNDQHYRLLSAIASIVAIKWDSLRKAEENAEKERELLQIEKEMIRLKSQALKVQMNPHFVFNALNAIQYFITENDKRNALHFLSQFSKLVRYYLDNFEREELELEKEFAMLKGYLHLQQLRYVDRFEYTLDIKNPEELHVKKVPNMILSGLVEQAIEKSVSDTRHKSVIQIHIESIEDRILVRVAYTIKDMKWSESNYREGLNSWEKQVQLLNKAKHYNIEKNLDVQHLDKETIISIQLKLPVLE